MADAMEVDKGAIDEDLYSRQLFVMGHSAQARMQQSDILIVGLRGIGVEIAKNIILMGIKSVTIFDPSAVTPADVSAQFYLSPADIGHSRASRSLEKLRALNQYVKVSVLESSGVDDAAAARFDVIVATDLAVQESARLNDLARSHGKKFVLAESHGVFGRVFSDFGPSFRVDDINDENPSSSIVASITNDKPCVVTTLEDQRHGLSDGDYVIFREVQGMNQLNDGVPRQVKVVDSTTFQLVDVDTSSFGKYVRGGVVTQVKMPTDVSFKPLSSMLQPAGSVSGPQFDEFVLSDFGKMDSVSLIHAAFSALHHVVASTGRIPTPSDQASIAAVLAATQSALASNEPMSDSQKEVVTHLARGAAGHLNPMAAALGGIAAQEVIKAVSGKFMPLRQWLYIDAVECLPSSAELNALPASEFEPTGTRYDGQIAVFGRSFQAKLLKLNLFLVGAGAIGCEMLKNWSMMGVGCGDGGSVTVTDMDRIEKSNLSRQFLFRPEDIGRAKSTTAAAAAQEMNPDLRAVAYELRVAPDTESTYNDEFWSRMDGICTALDNVEARKYVDGRCVYYGKPMMESGTLGTKGNTQIVVPRLTENYGASNDPPEQGIPVCTLKNFPNKIEHTLQWARDWFEGDLKQVPDSVNAYLAQPNFLEILARQSNTRIDTLEKIQSALVSERPTTIEDCVRWARMKFQDMFHNQIAQLLFNFPAESTTSNGEPFWSGAKRAPAPIEFNVDDPLHTGFILAAAKCRASLYGMKFNAHHTLEWLRSTLNAITIVKFRPREGVKIAANEKELEEQQKQEKLQQQQGAGAGSASSSSSSSAAAGGGESWDTESRAQALVDALPAPRTLSGFRLNPIEFEKDDDLHITLVTACSNLRARNYRIEETDKHTSKLIAGKIIPAIATTTALVTGLICLELYKLLNNKPIESYRNCFANLAIPIFAFSEPVPVKSNVLKLGPECTWNPPALPGSSEPTAAKVLPDGSREWQWSVWDRIDLSGPMTVDQFMSFFREQMGIEATSFCYGATPLMGPMLKPKDKRERLKQNVVHLAQKLSKTSLHAHVRYIIIEVMGNRSSDFEDVDLPYIRYRLGPGEIQEADAAGVAAGVRDTAIPSTPGGGTAAAGSSSS